MKHFILFIVLFICNISFGQTKSDTLFNLADSVLNEYDYMGSKKQVISPLLLNENLNSAFNNVVFSNSGLVSNASAFGYSQNKDKTNISANANFRIKKHTDNKMQWFLKVGINSVTDGNILGIYNKGSWSNSIGGNIGFILKCKGSTFFNIEKNSMEWRKNSISRKAYLYKAVLNKDSLLIRKDSLTKMMEELDSSLSNKGIKIQSLELKKLYQEEKGDFSVIFERLYNELDSINTELLNLSLNKNSSIDTMNAIKYYKNKAYEFDKNHDITYGYTFHWFDVNIRLNNGTYKFSDENIDTINKPIFDETYKLNSTYNKFLGSLNLNYNYICNAENILIYGQFGLGFNYGSLLSNSLLKGDPRFSDSTLLIIDENNNRFGSLKNIENSNINTGDINLYGAMFFGKEKSIGWNISYKHTYLIGNIKEDNYFFKNHFTLLTGPVFRKIKDDNTSLTFGIDFGWENAIYKTQINNDFTARLRVGIPFNLYKN